jgi:hypothetical protein
MESNNTSSSGNTTKIVGGIVAVVLCCACVVIGAAGYIMVQGLQNIPDLPTAFPPIDVPSIPTSTPEIERPTPDSISTETIETLGNTLVPENDPYDLACRLQAICNVPTTVPSKPYKLGDQETFWVTNVDTVENFQATATLRYVGDHIYFWIENGVNYSESDLKRLADTFEDQMYPTNREFFGSEPSPGIDGDPRIFILYVRGTGASNAGYYSTPDEYNPLVKEYSNGHEMFFFNADNMDLGGEDTYGTLAHEFQHMIHWNTDRNESSWVNEGFSMVAELLNGYPIFFDYYYVTDPDINLTDWSPDPGSNGPHYGQSFLYLAYLLDRYGEDATKEVVKHPENGLASIDETLAELNISDPQTGQIVTADDVFMDWAATMWLQDDSVGDGRFHYGNYPDAPNISVSQSIASCPQTTSGSVNQYGIDYFTITCAGDYTLNFSGSTVAKLLPADANSGRYAFWSNKGDESDMTLTREFDFTNVSAPITLSYAMWYDLETDYDYVFLEASTNGQTWEILTTPSCTTEDPSGNSYGCGYNAQTGDWVTEDVDLSQFAGQKVQIRFEYITDAAVNGEGFLLDDVRVDAAGYTSDFEADDGGWIAEGFGRVENVLPQTYRLSIIVRGETTTVTHIPVNADQTAEFPLSLKPGEEAILIVTGTTRYTRLSAGYQIEVK